jgi:hypothetical protein
MPESGTGTAIHSSSGLGVIWREVNEAETSLFLAEVERLMDAKGVVD